MPAEARPGDGRVVPGSLEHGVSAILRRVRFRLALRPRTAGQRRQEVNADAYDRWTLNIAYRQARREGSTRA